MLCWRRADGHLLAHRVTGQDGCSIYEVLLTPVEGMLYEKLTIKFEFPKSEPQYRDDIKAAEFKHGDEGSQRCVRTVGLLLRGVVSRYVCSATVLHRSRVVRLLAGIEQSLWSLTVVARLDCLCSWCSFGHEYTFPDTKEEVSAAEGPHQRPDDPSHLP